MGRGSGGGREIMVEKRDVKTGDGSGDTSLRWECER
jgi:hypothetical protein